MIFSMCFGADTLKEVVEHSIKVSETSSKRFVFVVILVLDDVPETSITNYQRSINHLLQSVCRSESTQYRLRQHTNTTYNK